MNERVSEEEKKKINDYDRLKLEYTKLHEDYRRLESEKLIADYYHIDKEINYRISERSRLFDILMDNKLSKVGTVIINSMNEHMAVILALEKIKSLHTSVIRKVK